MRRIGQSGRERVRPDRIAWPARPTVAVRPFDVAEGADGLRDFGERLVDGIAVNLGRGREFDVSSSAETARYTLNGKIRSCGGSVWIAISVIETESRRQLWAECFEQDMADLFAGHDGLARTVVSHAEAALRCAEQDRARRKRPDALDARDLFQRGMWHLYRFTRQDSATARRMFQDAIVKAPDFALPYGGLALNGYAEVTYGDADNAEQLLEEAVGFGETAVYLDEEDAFGHFALGRARTLLGRIDLAVPHLEKAIELNPGFGYAHYGLGFAHYWTGRCDRTVGHVERSIALSPRNPMLWSFHMVAASAHYQCGRYGLAEECARAAVRARAGEYWNHLVLSVALLSQNQRTEARAAAAEARRLKPGLSLTLVENSLPHLDARCLERYVNDMHAVGIPG